MQTFHLTDQTLDEAIALAATILASGGLVVYPTETMYGVGVDATNSEAVQKLLKFKNRPAGKAISVVVANQLEAEKYVELTESAKATYYAFLPGPVTVVSKYRRGVNGALLSELGNLGIRISSHPFVSGLAESFAKPFTATSANPSGGARPYSIESLLTQLSPTQLQRIDLIIDAGELPHVEPSTVIDTTSDVQEIIRAGAGVHLLAPPFHTYSAEETQEHGARLVQQFGHVLAEKPLIFALEGEMGMGKTQFAKGVAAGLDVPGIISSPTYSLIKEYKGSWNDSAVTFIHMDCWRAEHVTEEELDIPSLLKAHTVIVIEWAAPLLEWLKSLDDQIVVQRILFTDAGEDARALTIAAL